MPSMLISASIEIIHVLLSIIKYQYFLFYFIQVGVYALPSSWILRIQINRDSEEPKRVAVI